MRSCFSFLRLAVAACALFPVQAYAYIDLGTGSMIFQILAAGLIGALFTIKMYWLSLKQIARTLFLKMTGRAEAAGSKSKNDTDSKR